MNLKELVIDKITAPIPIIQGAMAVRISTAPLAAAVANEGGIGLIAGTGMSVKELRNEIRTAREMTKGIIGVNVMFAAKEFAGLVKASIEEKIDLVVSGAGFSRDMFKWGQEGNVPIVPIVCTAKLAKLSQKLGAAAVVVEGKEAGGHLGTDRPMKEILQEVKEAVTIPIIAAGGVVDGNDIMEALALGADGVQMGTRFAASEESNASKEFKELYLHATKDDVVIIDSPVGFKGRGLQSPFYDKIKNGQKLQVNNCDQCLKRCTHRFCILEALNNACVDGVFDNALVFAGEQVEKIREVLPVKKIFENLLTTIKSA